MRNTRLRIGFLIVLAWASRFASATATDVAVVSDAKTALKVLAESYLEHRASFPNLKVTFQWTKAKAESPAHALRGEFTERDESADCVLITAAGRRRYEFLCGPQAQAEFLETLHRPQTAKGSSMMTVKCLSDMLLESDGYALRYSVSGGSANLYVPDGQINDGVRVSPFNLHTMGADGASHPARYLNDALGGRFQYEYLGALEAEQPDLTVAVISERLRDQFSFDPARAYLLSRNVSTELKTSRRAHEMRVLNAVECSGGRWLPNHAVVVFSPDDPQATRVFEMRVVEYDPNYKDAPADWELELPANTQISVAGEVQWTRTSKDGSERFGPADFPKLYDRCKAKGKEYEERHRQSAELAKGRDPSHRNSSRRILLLVNFAVALTVGLYFLWRWRSRVLPNGKK